MEQREFILEAFADPASVRDVVRGILHTIFFHRYFPSVLPRTREVLDLTLPYVEDVQLETMIEQRAAAMVRQLDAERTGAVAPSGPGGFGGGFGGGGGGNHGGGSGGGRGQLTVQFFERKRRKAWLTSRDEEVCWESWTVKVTVAEPRTESERAKVRQAMAQTLLATVMKIVTFVNAHKDHIPPITQSDANPFPWQITVNQKETGWATRMGIYRE